MEGDCFRAVGDCLFESCCLIAAGDWLLYRREDDDYLDGDRIDGEASLDGDLTSGNMLARFFGESCVRGAMSRE